MSERVDAKQAATVILLRQASGGFEVFLTRRPEGMAFLGGMYCFPGGTVRKEDYSSALLQRCRGLTPEEARKIIGAHFAPAQALGFWIAATRELFEETGILFAVDDHGNDALSDEKCRNRIPQLHAAFIRKSIDFERFLEREKLFCDVSRLVYFSHWQTPSVQPIRFDTRFFLAEVADNQQPLASSPEVVDSIWVAPDEALNRFSKRQLPMIFPTFTSLRTLADFDSLTSVFKEYKASGSEPPTPF